MPRQELLDVPLGLAARLVDQPPLDGAPEDRLERCARLDLDVDTGVEELPVAAIAELEPVVGVVEGEPFGDALDRVDQALARAVDLAQALVLDLDRGVAKNHERPRHLADLVAGIGRRQRHPQIAPGDGDRARRGGRVRGARVAPGGTLAAAQLKVSGGPR
jgi:hypothetical protein